MIWCRGEVLPDDALRVSVLDRTFEHGLGLFETLRTWDGRPALLEAHRARMLISAEALGLDIDPSSLPDAAAVGQLLRAEGVAGDRMLRITASGGIGPGPSTTWMRSAPLPPPLSGPGAVVWLDSSQLAASDPLAGYKSLNYWSRRMAHESGRRHGCDETLIGSAQGWVEGSRSNLFLVRDGVLMTPRLDNPIVPGVMRGVIQEIAEELSIPLVETGPIGRDDLRTADEVLLTNAVRGIIPVSEGRGTIDPASISWGAPGPLTSRLRRGLALRLGMEEEPR